MSLPIPATPDDLSPEWLTAALRAGGKLPSDVVVTGFETTVLGEGKGFTGQVVRLDVQYDGAADAPASLIAKFPPADEEARAGLHYYRVYECEFGFYADLAEQVSLRVPQYYYGNMNLETGESILLLEDLAPARPYDLIGGVPPEEAHIVVRELARHHAVWWERDDLMQRSWLTEFGDEADGYQDKYQEAWPAFVAKSGDDLTPELADIGERLLPHLAWVRQEISKPPRTFLHGDFHPNNLFLTSEDGKDRLAVVDWQLCRRGRGSRDLMYFIVGALRAEDRVEHEDALLVTYHRELQRAGVENVSLEDVRDGYRFALLDLMHFLAVVIVLLDFEVNDEARAVKDLLFERLGGAIVAHNPVDLLPAVEEAEA